MAESRRRIVCTVSFINLRLCNAQGIIWKEKKKQAANLFMCLSSQRKERSHPLLKESWLCLWGSQCGSFLEFGLRWRRTEIKKSVTPVASYAWLSVHQTLNILTLDLRRINWIYIYIYAICLYSLCGISCSKNKCATTKWTTLGCSDSVSDKDTCPIATGTEVGASCSPAPQEAQRHSTGRSRVTFRPGEYSAIVATSTPAALLWQQNKQLVNGGSILWSSRCVPAPCGGLTLPGEQRRSVALCALEETRISPPLTDQHRARARHLPFEHSGNWGWLLDKQRETFFSTIKKKINL